MATGRSTEPGKYSTAGQTPEGIKLTALVATATSQVDGNKMMMKSPDVIVPMTGATSVVEIELVKAPPRIWGRFCSFSHAQRPFPAELMRIAHAAPVSGVRHIGHEQPIGHTLLEVPGSPPPSFAGIEDRRWVGR